MKFGKEYTSQMVQEWQEAYLDYNYLKSLLKDILHHKQRNTTKVPIEMKLKNSFKRSMSLYRSFSGLTSKLYSPRGSLNTSIMKMRHCGPVRYWFRTVAQTMFLCQ
ncbi:hypothetical protein Leryth_011289 [Lithospermum erythrorhizon]|nr:hypothetical protein Leryth_011289 [Lithospermum erythrorhizon]